MLKQLLISIDQVFNVLVWMPGDGFGCADETLSARSWRLRERVGLWRWIDAAFRPWVADHCRLSYESELARRHLPPEYRTAH